MNPNEPAPLQIACDESGYEGEKLVGGTTDVFAHASVHLDEEAAAQCMGKLREAIGSPATEYKANHLLRQKHRAVLIWLLGPLGPLHGNAHVSLIDKTFFTVAKFVDLLLSEVSHTAGHGLHRDPQAHELAVTLYREGRAWRGEYWQAFVEAGNNLLRAGDRHNPATSHDAFFHMIDVWRGDSPSPELDDLLEQLSRARPRAEAFRRRCESEPDPLPALDPLLPAIVHAVSFWGAAGRPVNILHHRQNTLSAVRISRLKEILHVPPDQRRGELINIDLLDSFTQPRIQLADILAGAVRKLASETLHDRTDHALTALIEPYVDESSIWGYTPEWPLGARPPI